MNGPAHVRLGAVCGLAAGLALELPWWQVLACAPLAVATSRLPDLDNRPWWRRLDKVIPDEALGHGGPMRHRGLLHWWALPLAAWVLVSLVGVSAGGVDATWVVQALIVGVASHIAGDLVFGRACRRQGRGPGIPLAPWWGHVGLGLKVDGHTEDAVRVFVLPVAFWYLVVAVALSWAWPATILGALTW